MRAFRNRSAGDLQGFGGCWRHDPWQCPPAHHLCPLPCWSCKVSVLAEVTSASHKVEIGVVAASCGLHDRRSMSQRESLRADRTRCPAHRCDCRWLCYSNISVTVVRWTWACMAELPTLNINHTNYVKNAHLHTLDITPSRLKFRGECIICTVGCSSWHWAPDAIDHETLITGCSLPTFARAIAKPCKAEQCGAGATAASLTHRRRTQEQLGSCSHAAAFIELHNDMAGDILRSRHHRQKKALMALTIWASDDD